MKQKRVWAAVLVVSGISISGIPVLAGNFWPSKPVVVKWCDAGSVAYPMHYQIEVWKDGSAELKVTPKFDEPEERLPDFGEMNVDGRIYKMAKRKDRDGKVCLFGSLPADSFALDRDLYFDMIAYDATGTKVAGDRFTQDVP